jgi:hypothetical protein
LRPARLTASALTMMGRFGREGKVRCHRRGVDFGFLDTFVHH